MRISNAGGPGRATASSRTRQTSGTGAAFQPEDVQQTQQAAGPRAAQAIRGVDALLAIQSVGDAMSGKKRAVQRGHSMLDALEDIRLDLLVGGVPRAKLESLLRLMQNHDDAPLDGNLRAVLDEIELRAQVELAKLDHLPG